MKNHIYTAAILIPAMLLAQGGTQTITPLSDALAAIGRAQTQQDYMQTTIATQAATMATQQAMITSLQSSDGSALLAMLNTKCPGCADFLMTNLPNTSALDGVIILCCGPATVPSTGPEKQMLYFYTTKFDPAVPAKAAVKQ